MKNILVVIGSARKGRVADKIVQYVEDDLATRKDIKITVADLATLHLPFFTNERPPGSPEFHEENPEVVAWAKLVADADAVIMVTPEYNHNLTGIQKNAIDWLFREWVGKPVAIVAYGWYAGKHSIAAIRELAPVIKIDLKPSPAGLTFNKDLATDGILIDKAGARQKIATAIDEIA